MTPQQIAAVKQSFALVVPIKEKAAELFYNRLFEIDPSTKPLFRSDMGEQGKKLMAALATVVGGLADVSRILPTVQKLAKGHVAYGVEPRHYDSVGKALLWTLEQGLGPKFTPEVRDAWASAYALLSDAMKNAAYGRASAA